MSIWNWSFVAKGRTVSLLAISDQLFVAVNVFNVYRRNKSWQAARGDMQKPDFEIVIESNPNCSMAPLYQGAAFAIATQGAKYIRLVHEPADFLVCHDTYVQGWRERPEGWLTEAQQKIIEGLQ